MRSATMLRWIWLVPAAMVNESERSRSSTNAPDGELADVVAGQAGPIEHAHGQVGHALEQLGVVELDHRAAGPGTPWRSACARLRLVMAHSASISACRWPISRRSATSSHAVPERRVTFLASSTSSPSVRLVSTRSEMNAGAPLEAERDHGDAPAVVLVADPVA